MMTELDIVDTASLRNILSVFGIFYLIVFCILPFFMGGIIKGLSTNITLFIGGILLVAGLGEGTDSPAFFDCWNTRVFTLSSGKSIDLKVAEKGIGQIEGTNGLWEYYYAVDGNIYYDEPTMYAMNDKNSPNYICSPFIFNPSSLWMCPGIFALPVLFCLFVVGSLLKSVFSGEK